jgi:hypothetical protein
MPKAKNPKDSAKSSPRPRVVSRAEVREMQQAEPEHVRALSPELEERIRARAYELFEQRGGEHGRAEEDWLRAEQEILNQRAARKSA